VRILDLPEGHAHAGYVGRYGTVRTITILAFRPIDVTVALHSTCNDGERTIVVPLSCVKASPVVPMPERINPRQQPSSAEDVLRERLTHAFTVPVDGPGFETAIDRLVAAVKAAGWEPAKIEGES